MESGRLSTGPHLDEVFGNNIKGKISPLLYLVGIPLALVQPWIGVIPDRRVERWLPQRDRLSCPRSEGSAA